MRAPRPSRRQLDRPRSPLPAPALAGDSEGREILDASELPLLGSEPGPKAGNADSYRFVLESICRVYHAVRFPARVRMWGVLSRFAARLASSFFCASSAFLLFQTAQCVVFSVRLSWYGNTPRQGEGVNSYLGGSIATVPELLAKQPGAPRHPLAPPHVDHHQQSDVQQVRPGLLRLLVLHALPHLPLRALLRLCLAAG